MSGPLNGLRVLVLAGMGPAPFASMLLADLGAEVVRVVRPPGSGRELEGPAGTLRQDLDPLNRGIVSVIADLKSQEDGYAVRSLAACADVFIEGFRPGVTERLGLGPEELLDLNPKLVYARLTGYGQTGPLAQTAGHDLNYVAQSGVLSLLGEPGGRPRPPLNLLGDYAGGAELAALGILAAVIEARASSRGQVIDAAMTDGVALLSARMLGLRAAGIMAGTPGTGYLDGGAPFYDTHQCADGRWLAVAAIEPTFYEQFLDGLGADTSGWPAQYDEAGWPRLRQLIGDALAKRPRDDWVRVYAGTDACVSPVLELGEAAEDPHNSARAVYQRLGDGTVHPAPAPRFSRTPARTPRTPAAGFSDLGGIVSAWRAGCRASGDAPRGRAGLPGGDHID